MKFRSFLLTIFTFAYVAGRAQNAPYNPDADDNQFINTNDLGSFLAVYGGPFISDDDDTDTTNELQTLQLEGNMLSISGGNTISLPLPMMGAAFGSLQLFTENGEWIRPEGCKAVLVKVQAGGGGGGWDSYLYGCAGGGGAGGYAEAWINDPPDTVAISVGAGGTGATLAASDGTSGGDSSFGELVLAGGGSAGRGSSPYNGGSGGSSSGGYINISGGDGWGTNGNGQLHVWNSGGSSSLGSGGSFNGLVESTGNGRGYGSGGAGRGAAGGNGAPGVVIVYEFY